MRHVTIAGIVKRLARIVVLLSLALALAALVLRVASNGQCVLLHARADRAIFASSQGAMLRVWVQQITPPPPPDPQLLVDLTSPNGVIVQRVAPGRRSTMRASLDPRWPYERWFGGGYSVHAISSMTVQGQAQYNFTIAKRGYAVAWILIVAMLLLPALLMGMVRLIIQMRRRAATAAGRCAQCGYDLRATPDRCPECGAAPAST